MRAGCDRQKGEELGGGAELFRGLFFSVRQGVTPENRDTEKDRYV